MSPGGAIDRDVGHMDEHEAGADQDAASKQAIEPVTSRRTQTSPARPTRSAASASSPFCSFEPARSMDVRGDVDSDTDPLGISPRRRIPRFASRDGFHFSTRAPTGYRKSSAPDPAAWQGRGRPRVDQAVGPVAIDFPSQAILSL